MSAQRQPFNPPRIVRFEITTWGTALRNCRIKAGLSFREVEAFVGIPKGTCKLWEDGEGFPSGYQLKGIYGRGLHALRAFAHLLPERARTQIEEIEKKDGSPPPAPTPAPPEDGLQELDRPRDFKAALHLARLAAGFNQRELGDLLSVHASTISNWETGDTLPIQAHYDKLIDLFPEMRAVAAPRGIRDSEKPGYSPGTQAAIPVRGPSSAEPSADSPAVAIVLRPTLAAVPSRGSSLEAAGAAYGRALADLAAKRGELAAAHARAASLAGEVQAASAVVDAALSDLHRIAETPST